MQSDPVIQSPLEGLPKTGKYLVRIVNVMGYLHNFPDYAGPRARIEMAIQGGGDAGKILVDNVSLPHPKESKGMLQRRVRIGHSLGLIPWGTQGTIQINWKSLQGRFCRVDLAYKNLGGRIVPTVDNYELMEYGAHTQPAHPLPLAGAEVKPVVEEYHEPTPPSPPVTCEPCPRYALNPWTPGPATPAVGAWCHYRMEHLVMGSPACEEFRRGEVPHRQKHERASQVQPSTSPAPQDHVLTCYECHRFDANHGPNPRQGWGKCLKRGRGRFGCATTCEAALTDDVLGVREILANAQDEGWGYGCNIAY